MITLLNMSHFQYYNYEGVGEKNKEEYWYSQAVRIGDRIECAGQGGLALGPIVLGKAMILTCDRGLGP